MLRDVSYGPYPSQLLDVFAPSERNPIRKAPLAVMIHGGGWVNGSRNDVVSFIPELISRQYVVANVGYRVASEAVAPAAAEDIRNAIEFVRSRATEWNADSGRILLVGFSAGAHLALLSALAPSPAIGGPRSHVRGIVSFWGITDVADLLEGDHAREFAQRWLPEFAGRRELARRLSPLNYDVDEAPPVCAVHSLHDDVVPFAHSERLIAKFQKEKRQAKLIELSHPGHAAPAEDYPRHFAEIFHFLDGAGVTG